MKSKQDRRKVYRVVLAFPLGMSRSVFVKAKNKQQAERRALRKYPAATGVDRSPYPQN